MSEEKIINMDSDINLPSDALSFTSASIQRFIDETAEFQFELGYEGKTLSFHGLADEWTINITPKSADLSVKGRDYLKNAIDNNFQKVYYLTQPASAPRNHYVDPGTGLGEALPYTSGVTLASEVAKEIAASVSLKLVWNCPDYDIINAYNNVKGFNGSVLSCLQELVRPLNQTEMYKIDILIQKDTIYIQKRQYPYIADYTLPYTDIRIKNLSITKTNYRSRKIRNIYIGRDERVTSAWGANIPTEKIEVIDTKDDHGEIKEKRIITTLSVGNSIIRKTEKTYIRMIAQQGYGTPTYELLKDETENYQYDGEAYSDYAKITKSVKNLLEYEDKWLNSDPPKDYVDLYKKSEQNSETVLTWGGTSAIATLESSHESYRKKFWEFNKTTGVVTQKLDKNKQPLIEVGENIIHYNRLNSGFVEVSTAKYEDGSLIGTTVAKQPGKPPQVNSSTTRNTKVSSFWWKKIEVLAEGEDLELHSDYFSRELLETIGSEIKTEQLAVKYELNLVALALPWLRKGMKLKISGTVSDGRGNSFDLSTLVFYITKNSPVKAFDSFLSRIEGVAWL